MRPTLATALVSVLATAAPAQGTPQQNAVGGSVLIRNVRVFDGEGVISKTSVLVINGKIARIAPLISAPAGTPVVDGSGKTLLPGLIDSHTHTWGTALRDDAALGVTTVLGMFTDPGTAAAFRKLDGTAAGREIADFRSAGVLVTAPKVTAPSTSVAAIKVVSGGDGARQSLVEDRAARLRQGRRGSSLRGHDVPPKEGPDAGHSALYGVR